MDKQAKKFQEKTKVSEKTATRVLSLLYDKGLDATTFSRLLRRIESFVIKTKLPEMIDKLNDGQINSLIDEIIIDDERMSQDSPIECGENLWLWLFSEFWESGKTYTAGDMVEIQIMRVWKRNHPAYWKIEISSKTLSEVKSNFDNNERQIELAVDENHEPNHKALARYRELYLKDNKNSLFAKLELTQKGADLLNEWAYKYFSPEIVFKKQDEESWKIVSNLLIGGAFTNRPFFKAMKPLLASEESEGVANNHQSKAVGSYSDILIFNNSNPMKTILELLAQFSELAKINSEQKNSLEAAFNSLDESDRTDEMKAAFNEVIAKFSDEADGAWAEGEGEGNGAWTDGEDNDGEGEWNGEGEGEGDQSNGWTVKANEDTVTIKASELESLKAKASEASKLVREARKNNANAKVNSMSFSESNKMGIVIPKNAEKIVEFALWLSEQQEKKFFEIIQNLQTVAASEIGHSGGTGENCEFSEEEIWFFTEKFGQSREEAILSCKAAKSKAK